MVKAAQNKLVFAWPETGTMNRCKQAFRCEDKDCACCLYSRKWVLAGFLEISVPLRHSCGDSQIGNTQNKIRILEPTHYRNKNMPHNKIPALAVWLLLSPSIAAAADTTPEPSSTAMISLVFGIATIAVGALLVIGLTLSSRKEEKIGSMMYFCIDFLINTKNKAERHRAAKLLGQAKNPEALLTLVDVINDESATDDIRKAAADALLDMSERYNKFKKVIGRLLIAAEVNDRERTVQLLTDNFEQEDKKFVQSAYIIGRELLAMNKYADARQWLHIAETRDRKHSLYVDQIRELTEKCNELLFSEGDTAFKAGDFHLANERFALAAHGLSPEVSSQFSSYLRAACVYCKLEDYENASQALLQGLQHQEETDTALELNTLVNKLINLQKEAPQAKEEQQNVRDELDRFVNQTMERLATQKPQAR